jgi:hypothetical protein
MPTITTSAREWRASALALSVTDRRVGPVLAEPLIVDVA